MTCTSPFIIKRKDGLRNEVPCGSCPSCRIARAREWATRCMHEKSTTAHSTFATLTYDDANLPEGGTLDKEQLQLFFKRLRKAIEPNRIRYYSCGEYGERNHRPHYHMLIFGMHPCHCRSTNQATDPCTCGTRKILTQAWGLGAVGRCGTVTYDSARYCADYIGKQLIGEDKDFYKNKQRPFALMSLGLGRDFLIQNAQQLTEQRGCTIHGAQVGLPRYYAKKLGINWRDIEIPIPEVGPSKRRLTFVGKLPVAYVELTQMRNQRNANTVAKTNIKKKGTL